MGKVTLQKVFTCKRGIFIFGIFFLPQVNHCLIPECQFQEFLNYLTIYVIVQSKVCYHPTD